MPDKRQRIVRWFGICADIDEHKLLEDALAEQSQALAQSNDDLQSFAFAASHDLQEPLKTIGIFSELLIRDHAAGGDSAYLIDQIKRGLQRMRDLVNASLEYSRIGACNAEIQTIIRLEEPLSDALWSLKVAIEESAAQVSHDPLPEVLADSRMISRVFQNLIGNAIKFRRASEQPVIRITASEEPGVCVVAVSDNGIGMPMDEAKTVFEAFRRLHSKERYPGAGLGLASVKRIIELHQGRIWVESTPGRGSTFFFTLPSARR